jgi:hypothetical protein
MGAGNRSSKNKKQKTTHPKCQEPGTCVRTISILDILLIIEVTPVRGNNRGLPVTPVQFDSSAQDHSLSSGSPWSSAAPQVLTGLKTQAGRVGNPSPSPSPFFNPQSIEQPLPEITEGERYLPTSYPSYPVPSFIQRQLRQPLPNVTHEDEYYPAQQVTQEQRQELADNLVAVMANPQLLQEDTVQSPAGDAGSPQSGSQALSARQRRLVESVLSAVRNGDIAIGQANQGSSAPNPSLFTVGPTATPHIQATRQEPKLRFVPTPFPCISKEVPNQLGHETIETIRSNMDRLLDDGPVSDLDFARMHYEEDGASFTEHCLREANRRDPPANYQQHSLSQLLGQRAESSAYAQRMGEQPPSYAFVAPDLDEKGRVVKKKMPAKMVAGQEAVVEKSDQEYDAAFERNLRSM